MSDQKKLLDFVNDPENLKNAVEGSMAKRQKIIDQASDQTIELKIEDAMNIIIEISEASSVGEITCAQFNELAQEQFQALLQAVNEARKDEVRLYTNNIELNGGGFDPALYEKNRLAQLTPKENIEWKRNISTK